MNLTQRQKDVLNRACAEMCGRRLQEVFPMNPEDNKGYIAEDASYFIACNHPEEQICFCCELRDYCTDRNALPEIWAAVEREGKGSNYGSFLCDMVQHRIGESSLIAFEKVEPYIKVISALKACDRWTSELSAIMEEEA